MSETTPAVRNLPSYDQLVAGDLDLKNQQNEVNILLNQEPPKPWLKESSSRARSTIVLPSGEKVEAFSMIARRARLR